VLKDSFYNILNNKNLHNTFIIASGTIIGSFFSYLLQFSLGRVLSVSDYGTFNALISLSSILGIPATVFSVAIVKRVAEYTARGDRHTTSAMFKSLSLVSVLVGALIFSLLVLVSPGISTKLQIGNITLVIYFSLLIGLSLFSAIPLSFIQGLMLYRRWAFFTTIASFLRLIFALLPVLFGLGLEAVFLGLSGNVIITYFLSVILLWKIFTKEKSTSLIPEYKKLILFGSSTLLVSLGLIFMNNIDMVLVKRYFDSVSAGYYAGAVTVGKILLFGSTAVTTLMFPSISALYAQKKNFKPQLKQLFLIQTILVAVGLIIFELFPGFITSLFFGPAFFHSVPYLKAFSIFITLYVFIYFLVMFCLSIEKTKVYLCLIPGIITQYLLISYYHENIFQIINADIISALITLIILSCYLFSLLRKSELD